MNETGASILRQKSVNELLSYYTKIRNCSSDDKVNLIADFAKNYKKHIVDTESNYTDNKVLDQVVID